MNDELCTGKQVWLAALAGVGVLVLVMQLLLGRCRVNRPLRIATTAIAVGVCLAVLATGHQPQRARSPKHESLEGLLLRNRPVAAAQHSSSG
ncbi:MAG: hypothetical protein ABW046_08785 [Actinoplanes sp.]